MIGVTFVSHSVKMPLNIISGADDDHPFQLPSTSSQNFSKDGATALSSTSLVILATLATLALRTNPTDASNVGKVDKVVKFCCLVRLVEQPLEVVLRMLRSPFQVGLTQRLRWEELNGGELREIMEPAAHMALFTSAVGEPKADFLQGFGTQMGNWHVFVS